MHRRKAIGSTIIVAIVVIVIAGAIGLAIVDLQPGESKSSTSLMSSTSSNSHKSPTSSGAYQVVASNLTLEGQTAIVPCMNFEAAACPPASYASITRVQLIKYGDELFYLYNQTAPTLEAAYQRLSEPTTSFTVWFTNSTVYCISPADPVTHEGQLYPTCPNLPLGMVKIPVGSASALNSSLGLRLSLDLSTNSTGTVIVAVDERNTVGQLNNVTARHLWPVNNAAANLFLWTQNGCGPPLLPVGYEVLQGNYGRNNFTQGIPLALEAQMNSYCGPQSLTNYYAFDPLSDRVSNIYNNPVNSTGTWSGFWIGDVGNGPEEVSGSPCPGLPSPSSDSSYKCPLVFNQFALGTYTVVAGDEWGQVVILHFVVQGQ